MHRKRGWKIQSECSEEQGWNKHLETQVGTSPDNLNMNVYHLASTDVFLYNSFCDFLSEFVINVYLGKNPASKTKLHVGIRDKIIFTSNSIVKPRWLSGLDAGLTIQEVVGFNSVLYTQWHTSGSLVSE